MHYSRNKKRNIIEDDLLYRQYYKKFGELSHLQVRLPGQFSKWYYNHYMEQLPNTQAFAK